MLAACSGKHNASVWYLSISLSVSSGKLSESLSASVNSTYSLFTINTSPDKLRLTETIRKEIELNHNSSKMNEGRPD